MRSMYLNFNFIYCIVLVVQVLAVHNDTSLSTRDRSPGLLRQGGLREDLKDTSRIETKNFATLPRVSAAPFSQSLATYTVDFDAFCERKEYDDGTVIWQYNFVDATCDTDSGDPRRIIVRCNSWYHIPYGQAMRHPGGIQRFSEECPEGTVCQPTSLIRGRRTRNEAVCVDEEEVTTEKVTPENSHADPNAPDVHCSMPLALPGNVFTVKPGVQSIDITLTEEARFHDGTPYPAPMLYIRDKTSHWGFDRAFRRHASVASTQLTMTAVKGKFQTRIFEFCMQLTPGLTASAVIFTHSWFQTTSRHGRIPEQLQLKQDNHNDTSH